MPRKWLKASNRTPQPRTSRALDQESACPVVHSRARRLRSIHALSGVDTPPPAVGECAALLVQWGHAVSGVDTKPTRVSDAVTYGCFNGATPFQAWIRAS